MREFSYIVAILDIEDQKRKVINKITIKEKDYPTYRNFYYPPELTAALAKADKKAEEFFSDQENRLKELEAESEWSFDFEDLILVKVQLIRQTIDDEDFCEDLVIRSSEPYEIGIDYFYSYEELSGK